MNSENIFYKRVVSNALLYRNGPSPILDEELLSSSKLKYNNAPLGVSEYFASEENEAQTKNAGSEVLIIYFAKLGRSYAENIPVDLNYVKTLIQSGADVNFTDNFGQTVLHEAALRWPIEVAQFLFNHSANLNKADKYGRTPLHVAASVDYPEMVKWLIDNGADVHAITLNENQTPLHYASKCNSVSSLVTLLEMGARLDDTDFKERTPLQIAAETGREESCRILLQYGAPAGVYDDTGMPCLTHLIEKLPDVAAEALDQFQKINKGTRTTFFYLSYLEKKKWKMNRKLLKKSHRMVFVREPLEVIVKYKDLTLIMHPVIQRLIQKKTQLFGRRYFIFMFLINLLFTVLWTALTVTLPHHNFVSSPLTNSNQSATTNPNPTMTNLGITNSTSESITTNFIGSTSITSTDFIRSSSDSITSLNYVSTNISSTDFTILSSTTSTGSNSFTSTTSTNSTNSSESNSASIFPVEFYTPYNQNSWRFVLEILGLLLAVYFFIQTRIQFMIVKRNFKDFKVSRLQELRRDMNFCHPRWPQEQKVINEEEVNIKSETMGSFYDVWFILDVLCYVGLAFLSITRIMLISLEEVDNKYLITLKAHYYAFPVILFIIWLRFMSAFRPFITLGPFIAMFGCIAEETVKFAFLFMEFLIPYACAIWIVFGGPHEVFQSSQYPYTYFDDVMFELLRMTVTDNFNYAPLYTYNAPTLAVSGTVGSTEKIVAQIITGTFFALMSITLMNLYIGLLSNTFSRVFSNATATAYMLQAEALVIAEKKMRKKDRNTVQKTIAKKCSPEVVYEQVDEEDTNQVLAMLEKIGRQLDFIQKFQVDLKMKTDYLVDEGALVLTEHKKLLKDLSSSLQSMSK